MPRQSSNNSRGTQSAMFSQNPNSHQYANQQGYGSGVGSGGHHAYQQMYGYGQHGNHLSSQSHQSASPHQQHYSHVPGSSVGLGGAGQFSSASGGPMMGSSATDYPLHSSHPSYTHMHPSHTSGYGAHFQMPGNMQHLQGQQGLMVPGTHSMPQVQNPVALHGQTATTGTAASGGGRSKKSAAAAAPAKAGKKGGKKGAEAASGKKGAAGKGASAAKGAKGASRQHPYKGETKEKKKPKKEDAPKPVLRSHLKPPKQAPSAWQVYFTEELQKMKAEQPGERLNVAHVAKDAGQRYAALPDEKKREYQRKSLEEKAKWERDMENWRQTLTPEDIKQENMYRTAQRKAGKSRKGNLKDPNAPKKPLSAYFLFLRAIRADAGLTQSVFEGEQETTKQSVLAASKWRALPEAEKQPYLEKAEADKAEYERLRREYEATQGGGRSKGGRHDDDPSQHFKMDAAFHDDHFIGAGSLDDHFGTNPDGSSLKPEDLM